LATIVDEYLRIIEGLMTDGDTFWAALNWPEVKPIVEMAFIQGQPELAAYVAVEWALRDEEMHREVGAAEVDAVIGRASALMSDSRSLDWGTSSLKRYAEQRLRIEQCVD